MLCVYEGFLQQKRSYTAQPVLITLRGCSLLHPPCWLEAPVPNALRNIKGYCNCAAHWALIYLPHSNFLWDNTRAKIPSWSVTFYCSLHNLFNPFGVLNQASLGCFELLLSDFHILPPSEHRQTSQHAKLQISDLNLSRGCAEVSVRAVQQSRRESSATLTRNILSIRQFVATCRVLT